MRGFFYVNPLGIYMPGCSTRRNFWLQNYPKYVFLTIWEHLFCQYLKKKKDSQIMFYRYCVFALLESRIKQDIKWIGSVHRAPACGTTNLNKLIEFLKLTGN